MTPNHFALLPVRQILISGLTVLLGAQSPLMAQPGETSPPSGSLAVLSGAPVAAEDALGRCMIWRDRSVLFAPESEEKWIRDYLAGLTEPSDRYQIGGRWTTVAHDASVSLREPVTITYSFVPDGTSIGGYNGEPDAPSELFARMDTAFGGTAAWQGLFEQAFNEWGEVTGITYEQVADDGATFLSSPGALGARGDVRISMHYIDGASGSNVLAYNFFPNNGDMVIDSGNIGLWASPSNGYRALRNVLMHEHGHGLGFYHVDPVQQTKLMEPYLSTSFDGPQEDDIRAAQRQYGDPFEINDAAASAIDLDVPASVSSLEFTEFPNLALEDGNSADYFGLVLPDNAQVMVTLTPVGTSYLQGPQNGATAAVNALAALNLDMDLIAPDGTTVVASANTQPAGNGETLGPLTVTSGSGRYFLRIDSPESTGVVQRYELSAANIGALTTPFVTSVTARDSDGSAGYLDATQWTNSRTIEIVLGDLFGPAPEYVEVAEDAAFTSSTVIAYTGQSSVNYTVSPGDGVKTVWARVGNSSGVSAALTASIRLDATPPTSSIAPLPSVVVQVGNPKFKLTFVRADTGSVYYSTALWFRKGTTGSFAQVGGDITLNTYKFDTAANGGD
ncbi:matrixin family metalloprotease, partial [Candidatus Poribacteria bacterium]|nr:matrixin family metalloprotease [Candidatus Poribacteria bacterium]